MTVDAVTIGLRVADARARASMTQADLARETALDRSALAKIEGGVRRVTALELARIADAVGSRIEWFLTEAPPSIVSHRNAREPGAPSPAIDEAVESAARDVEFVREHDPSWKLPNIPTFERPANREAAENLASQVRGLLDLDDRPAYELIQLAESLGLTTFGLDLGPGEADGATVLLQQGGVAVVNGALFTGRRRLTLAHELGHYLCADDYSVDWRLGETEDAVSWEARLDWFARALLLPAQGLNAFIDASKTAGDNPRTTAIRAGSHFRVDMSTLARRMLDIGICDWSEASAIRSYKTTKSDIIELNLLTHEELSPPAMPRGYARAVLRLYRAEVISGDRAIDLMRGILDDEALPELAPLPGSAIWSFT